MNIPAGFYIFDDCGIGESRTCYWRFEGEGTKDEGTLQNYNSSG